MPEKGLRRCTVPTDELITSAFFLRTRAIDPAHNMIEGREPNRPEIPAAMSSLRQGENR